MSYFDKHGICDILINIDSGDIMDTDIKGYDLFWELYNNNSKFKNTISKNMELGKIRFFNDK